MKNKILFVLIYIAAGVAAAALGVFLFLQNHYMLLSLLVAVLCCLAFFLKYERGNQSSAQIVTLCSVIALSVAGRCVFSVIPFFKPVTAIVIISGLYFGKEFAFLAGALSALISNFVFSQGMWTPFQMAAWGMCGFCAALLANALKKHKIWLCLYGAAAGLLYSLIVDINTVFWIDKYFSLKRYLAVCITSFPFTVTYAVSNVLFIILLARPLEKTFVRIKTKYGLNGI
ncbi:MAG: ECF transporter S component [Clostridiales bacterium]|nr:ECF transporter S component [Clostridiales bacterium]